MLYKLKTSKVFEKPKAGEGRAAELVEEDPFAVQMVSWCPQSRIFCVVGISAHIILYRFSKYDANTQIVVSYGLFLRNYSSSVEPKVSDGRFGSSPVTRGALAV